MDDDWGTPIFLKENLQIWKSKICSCWTIVWLSIVIHYVYNW